MQGLLEKSKIGRGVDQQHDALQRHRGNQLLDLEDAAPVGGREAAQVHQHRRCVAREPRDRHPPGVVMAEEVLDAVKTIGIGDGGTRRQTALEVSPILDEGAAQPPVQELEELERLDRGGSGIGAADQPDRTEMAPAPAQILEQPLGAPVVAEDAQQQQHARRRRCRPQPAKSL